MSSASNVLFHFSPFFWLFSKKNSDNCTFYHSLFSFPSPCPFSKSTVNVITKKNPSLVSAALSSSYLGEPLSMFGCILRSRTSQYTNYPEPFKRQQLIALIYSWDCGESSICGDERLDNTSTPPKFEKAAYFILVYSYMLYTQYFSIYVRLRPPSLKIHLAI